jgi:predicted ATP-binding protein involved in virulence
MEQQTLTISESLYNRLAAVAQLREVGIEQLLEEWERRYSEIRRHHEAVREINELRERIFAKHGVMPDSTKLIREDRER